MLDSYRVPLLAVLICKSVVPSNYVCNWNSTVWGEFVSGGGAPKTIENSPCIE